VLKADASVFVPWYPRSLTEFMGDHPSWCSVAASSTRCTASPAGVIVRSSQLDQGTGRCRHMPPLSPTHLFPQAVARQARSRSTRLRSESMDSDGDGHGFSRRLSPLSYFGSPTSLIHGSTSIYSPTSAPVFVEGTLPSASTTCATTSTTSSHSPTAWCESAAYPSQDLYM
jgi:hypothetical protein